MTCRTTPNQCGHFGPYVTQEPCGGKITIMFDQGRREEVVSVTEAYVLCDQLLRAANGAAEAQRKMVTERLR